MIRKPFDPEVLRSLLPFATQTQKAAIDAVMTHGSCRAAARVTGEHKSTISGAIQRAKERAALQGWSPDHDMTHTAPSPFVVKGVSTMYDGEGNLRAQWVKTKLDEEMMEQRMRLFVQELVDSVVPKVSTVKPPRKTGYHDIMVGYPLGDHHFGMLAWGRETGNDYDLEHAKDSLANAIDHLIAMSPPSETALFCNLGDFLHTDNRTNRTPQSGHQLDVDSRFAKIIRVAAYSVAYAIERLLEKHHTVKVVNVAGNHDPDSTSWVSLVLEAYFRKEPRIIVDKSPAKIQFHQFGSNMIGMTHGDTMKLQQLAGVMASYQPKMWGETTHRYAWTGHVHHSQTVFSKENHGVRAESFGVLGPLDAYGASVGHLAQREMHAIVYRKEGGEQGRVIYNLNEARDYI